MKRLPPALFFLCAAMTVCGQETNTLDWAIKDSMEYLVERLEPGTKVAILNFNAFPTVSTYVIEEITVFLDNDQTLTIVDRSELELLQGEMNGFYAQNFYQEKPVMKQKRMSFHGLTVLMQGYAERLGKAVGAIKEAVISSPAVRFDEMGTGVRSRHPI